MANPLTAIYADVLEDDVITLLETLETKPGSCEIKLVSKGSYGFVFQISLHNSVVNPFQTFNVDPEQSRTIVTSVTQPDSHHVFCCKLVPITENEGVPIVITKDANQVGSYTSNRISFTNECNKQRQIYAKTNERLNSICLPLFFYKIVDSQDVDMRDVDMQDVDMQDVDMQDVDIQDIFYRFIRYVFQTCRIDILIPPGTVLLHGIAFMPFSVNTHTFLNIPRLRSSSAVVLTDKHVVSLLLTGINDSYSRERLTEERIIEIFRKGSYAYAFVSVVSILTRLYSIGYCHGDLHSGNIVIFPFPSAMTEKTNHHGSKEVILFGPSFSLIDFGFAFQHERPIPQDILTNYDSFKFVIQTIITIKPIKPLGETMLSFPSYQWFPMIFFDGVGTGQPTFNENRCKVIFKLFSQFERYRREFETSQLRKIEIMTPGIMNNFEEENKEILQSVDAYIASIPGTSPAEQLHKFNIHGGRRRRIYNAIKRKQTKNTKKHSRNRNRSLTRSRRSRRRSRRGPTKLK
jgi:hypothetical protein